ncbi:MAG: ribose-phosphate pyrophosphokinase-like domain-containing protein [Vicinamibacterales bacterium]
MFTGSAHQRLAREIAQFSSACLGRPGCAGSLGHRGLRSRSTRTSAAPTGTLVQPTWCSRRSASTMLTAIDAFRRSSAARITAVIPYYGWLPVRTARDRPRVPISAKLVANVIACRLRQPGADDGPAQGPDPGVLRHPVDHLFAAPVIIDHLARQDFSGSRSAPDAAGAERARAYAKRLDAELAVIDKRRTEDGTAEVMNVIGDIRGRTCDCRRHHRHRRHHPEGRPGASRNRRRVQVFAQAVHGALSGPAIERIEKSPIDKLDRHQHDSALEESSAVRQDRRAVGGPAARSGHRQHSRRDIGVVALRLGDERRQRPAASGWRLERTRLATRIRKSSGSDTVGSQSDGKGKNEARWLRASGQVPVVVYGAYSQRRDRPGADRRRSEGDAHPHSASGVNTLITLNGPVTPPSGCWSASSSSTR